MRAPGPFTVRRGVQHRAPRLASILAILAVALGCAAPAPPLQIPAELPLVTNEQLFEFRWALQRDASRARAVGLVTPSFDTEFSMTLGFYGVDAGGRIVSRGTTYVRSNFATRSTPFSVDLTPTGREERFELRIIDHQLPGLRMF
jgi:hypothetical protein